MQTIQFLVLATAIAALIAVLNVSQVAHAQSPGTCQVGSNANNNPTSNPKSGNPHCFDPEQQPTTATATPAQTCAATSTTCGTGNPGGAAAMGNGACASGATACTHPQSTNPQGHIVGNPHEEPSTTCQGVSTCRNIMPASSSPAPDGTQGSLVGNPHVPTR